jgi:hypothetical protein
MVCAQLLMTATLFDKHTSLCVRAQQIVDNSEFSTDERLVCACGVRHQFHAVMLCAQVLLMRELRARMPLGPERYKVSVMVAARLCCSS